MLYPGYEPEEPRNGSLMPRLLIGQEVSSTQQLKRARVLLWMLGLGSSQPLSHGYLSDARIPQDV